MKTRVLPFLAHIALGAVLSAQAFAAGSPWFGDEGECRNHWSNSFDSCRIRHDADSSELTGMDLRLAQAQAARDTAAKNTSDSASNLTRLDGDFDNQQNVLIPTADRAVHVAAAARDLLKSASDDAVTDSKALLALESTTSDRPQLSAAAAAGLAAGVTDTVSLSMILDATLTHAQPLSADETKTVLDVRTTDFDLILARLETSVNYTVSPNAALATSLAKLAADDETLLENARRDLGDLASTKTDAQSRKTRADKTLADADQLLVSLADRKKTLPDLIRGESDCMATSASYRDSQCTGYWAHAAGAASTSP